MKKTFDFGKIAYAGDRKVNAVEVTVELKENEQGIKTFRASANVWNSTKTDIVAGGQCLDELNKYKSLRDDKEFSLIYEMWQKYHLNDLHAGTERQEDALKQAVAEGKLEKYGANNYEETCNYLQSIGLLEDNEYLVPKKQEDGSVKEVPYKYGTGWITQEIPSSDLELIETLISGEEYDDKIKEKVYDRKINSAMDIPEKAVSETKIKIEEEYEENQSYKYKEEEEEEEEEYEYEM